jgi:hypothetical protein
MAHGISKWQVVRDGIDSPSYYQGCGVALTEYDNVVTGVGDTEREAFDDALEQLAMSEALADGVVDALERTILADEHFSDESATEDIDDDDDRDELPQWYVSIRYSLA